MKFIQFNQVFYQYPEAANETFALRDVSFTVEQGDFIAIAGANSSGKTTLGRLCNMLLMPTQGALFVDGLDTMDVANTYPVRKKIGMIFQNPDNQIVSTTVEEEIAFGLENLQIPTHEIQFRVETILREMHLESIRNRPPHLLSGGQKQLLCIASVLAMEPSCIIFDEPTSLLDPLNRKIVLQQIQKLHKKGITILYITHLMEELLLANRLLILKEGSIVFEGQPMEVFSFPASVLFEYHLYPPKLIQVMEQLRATQIPLPKNITSTQQLVDQICRLK